MTNCFLLRLWIFHVLLIRQISSKATSKESLSQKTNPKTSTLPSSRPHIIFIILDDLGSHDLGFHNGSGIYTPNCDQLTLQEGIYLSQYYVLPTCSPTRSAIMSGMYPLHTGIHIVIQPESTIGLPLHVETLPQVLQRIGKYQTHAVGKWHLGHSSWEQTPTYRGFDSFFGYYLGGQDYYTHSQLGRYDMRWDKQPNCGEGCSQIVNETGNYSTHIFTREAIRRIQEYNTSFHNESSSPLFLYLAYQAVHSPKEVPSSYQRRYQSRRDWTTQRKTYAGMLTAVDEGIGNITLALKEYGLWENTILVLSTDNGGPTEVCSVQGSSNYPRRGGKCTVWEGGTSGDAILSGPYLSQKLQIPVPGTYDGIVHAVDWLPTLSDIAMSSNGDGDDEEDDIVSSNDTLLPPLLDGVSQLQALRTGQPARTEVFVGYGFDQHQWYGPAIRVHQWKLIEGTTGGPDARNPKVPAVFYDFTTTTASNQMHPPFFNSHHQQQSQYFEENTNRKTSRDSKSNNVLDKEEEDEGTIEKSYLLYNLELDREEKYNLAHIYPEIVAKLSIQLEAYKREFTPVPPENEDCPYHTATTNSMGPIWLPWCNTSKTLVVYV